MTWCFDCKLDQNREHLEICKELAHDIDYEGLYYTSKYEINQTRKIPEEKSKYEKENSVEKLARFAPSLMTKLVISQDDNTRVFVIAKTNNHYETIELDKRNSKAVNWLMVSSSNELKQMYSEDACASAIGFLKAKALMKENTTKETIHLRCAYVNGAIYYDLGRADWKIIKITGNGIAYVDYSKDVPVFVRTSKISQQNEPDFMPEGDPLGEFFKMFNIPNSELFKVHLIAMFLEGIITPIMAIHGHAGAAKSTVASIVKRIIDPSGNNSEDNLKSFPKGEDNFATSMASSYFSAFENISYIDDTVSDILCRAVTGGSFEKRAHYTNSEVYTIAFKRKFSINGIDFAITQADLADRTVVYEFERISEEHRKTDKTIEEAFRKLLPSMLGQIFLVLQKVLSTVEVIEKNIVINPRMASFATYGEAIYQALGHKHGEFLEIYQNSIKKNLENLNDSNPIVSCLEYVLSERKDIELTANDLYRRIKSFVDSEGYNSKRIPQGSNGLTGWITRSKALLDENKIKVEKFRNTQSKAKSGFFPNATVYKIIRIEPVQMHLKDELDV